MADPGGVARALTPSAPVTIRPTRKVPPDDATAAMVTDVFAGLALPDSLRTLIARRAGDLTDYQHAGYGRRYAEALRRVADREHTRTGDHQLPVTTAAAHGLHKLMAYKDEYEVARLHLLERDQWRIEDELGSDVRTRVMLHPPLLRAMGLRHKIGLGRSARPAFTMLRAGRRLRGTRFDPFGHTSMRRAERSLVTEYLGVLDAGLSRLEPGNTSTVARLAGLPDLVRGYEDVKWRNIEAFRAEAARLLHTLDHGADAAAPLHPPLPLAG